MLSKVTLRVRFSSKASGMEAGSLPRADVHPEQRGRLAVMRALPPNIGMVPRVCSAVSKFMPPPEAPT